jgi:hypothetical protein
MFEEWAMPHSHRPDQSVGQRTGNLSTSWWQHSISIDYKWVHSFLLAKTILKERSHVFSIFSGENLASGRSCRFECFPSSAPEAVRD